MTSLVSKWQRQPLTKPQKAQLAGHTLESGPDPGTSHRGGRARLLSRLGSGPVRTGVMLVSDHVVAGARWV